jgi:Rieske Fe-S protein
MNRRDFVEVSLTALGSAAVAGCASLQTVPVTPEQGRARIVVRNHPSLDHQGGSLKVLPDGWTAPLYVLAVTEGYVVVSPICTHQGCTVGIEGTHLVCPCHGSTYTREGTVVRGPAEEPLRRFPATLHNDGVLEIDLEGTA